MRARLLGRVLAFGLALASVVLALPRPAGAEEEALEKAKAVLLAAATKHDVPALSKALDDAAALVGPAATFPDLGALSDWLGTLPEEVQRLPVVRVRRGWLYVAAHRGADALEPLKSVLDAETKNGVVRAYYAEALRQAGNTDGALIEFRRGVADGANDEHVVPSLRKMVYDSRKDAKEGPAEALPPYAALAVTALAVRDMPDVRVALVQWLGYDADRARATRKRAVLLRAEALRQAYVLVSHPPGPLEGVSLPRIAYDAAGWAVALQPDGPAGLPERFDCLAACVRLMAASGADTPEVPEAYAALAEEALGKARYVLAARMARKRLETSDSPTARRVLSRLPPDVGD